MNSKREHNILSRGREKEQGIFNSYLDCSLAISLLLWGGLYLTDRTFLPDSFFLSTLVVTNFITWSVGKISFYKELGVYTQLFFLLQITLLVGMGVEYHSISALVLALFPTVFGVHHMLMHKRKSEYGPLVDGAVLLLITVGVYIYWQEFFHSNLLLNRDGMFLFSALLWGLGMIYAADGYGLQLVMRKGKQASFPRESESDNRLFFHDIINHTHGLQLFLRGRVDQEQGISAIECGLIANDIELMQAQLQDHFGYRHRNLASDTVIQPFALLKSDVESIISNFLPSDRVELEIIFKSQSEVPDYQPTVVPITWISNRKSEDVVTQRGSALHIPSFIRILTNLVKNISDDRSRSVQVIFYDRPEGLTIITKSRLFQSDSSLEDVRRDGVEHLFSHEGDGTNSSGLDRSSGLGHESIAKLCQEQGGSFDFIIEGEFWVNQVFLPDQNSSDKILNKWAA
ncbi:MAG: hypothetical protein HN353_10980 [Bdellovibrionales bacterium]|jgi:hypothetical protein|nr:hypothetical protein [Bdellovibrionales bacterium]MBT3525209.1 hypothetical protein [Bdellovibrionales bacterium]MBT7768186.1 hypothetical protein [Bdellovibrionales bacterium]